MSDEADFSAVELHAGGMRAPQSPFADLLTATPGDDELPERGYQTPSLVARVRPIGGMQEHMDPFRVRYTARAEDDLAGETYVVPRGRSRRRGISRAAIHEARHGIRCECGEIAGHAPTCPMRHLPGA